MTPGIRVVKQWSDEDVIDLRFEVCDGRSLFVNTAYASVGWIGDAVNALRTFGRQIHGGIYDLKAGEFGLEFANGAFLARLHFPKPGRLFISTHQQSDYSDFKGSHVASEARLFLMSEPVLLDRFIEELGALNRGEREDATLEGA
jgi:hypothetical protein